MIGDRACPISSRLRRPPLPSQLLPRVLLHELGDAGYGLAGFGQDGCEETPDMGHIVPHVYFHPDASGLGPFRQLLAHPKPRSQFPMYSTGAQNNQPRVESEKPP